MDRLAEYARGQRRQSARRASGEENAAKSSAMPQMTDTSHSVKKADPNSTRRSSGESEASAALAANNSSAAISGAKLRAAGTRHATSAPTPTLTMPAAMGCQSG